MAKTGYITIPDGLDLEYKRVIQSGDRFIYPHVKVKRLFISRSRKKGLTQKSLLVSLAPIWNAFDTPTKDAWTDAGAESVLTGFKLFVQDTAKRIANDLVGYATPSTLYQSMVGRIQIEAPAIGLTILQLHPQTYYVNSKVRGTRSQYEPKLITENLSLPVDIAISYSSYLVSAGGSPRARFFVIVYSNYQGQTIENECVIDFDLIHAWERKTATISGVVGQFRGYTAFIEINDAQGTLLFDNVEIVHTGQNWARDPFCNSIQTSFTKAFYQIPKNWAPEEIVDGAFFASAYHDLYLVPLLQGANAPLTASNEADPALGIAWTNPNNAKVADTVVAFSTIAIPSPFSATSQRLRVSNFAFSVPAGATITGIEVNILRKDVHLFGGGASDNEIKLIKGGSIVGSNKAVAGTWPSSLTYATYGGVNDLWGETWDVSDINATDFGVGVIANLVSTGGSGLRACSAQVDFISITVHYTML